MLAMVVITNGGGIAAVTDHTDWPTQQICEQMKATLFPPTEGTEIGGVRLTIRTNAQCVPIDGAQAAVVQPPPRLRYSVPHYGSAPFPFPFFR